MRRNLIVVRAADDSRHPEWVAGNAPRNFDLFVSYFAGKTTNRFADDCDFYEAVPGMKWPRLHRLYQERASFLLAYDACCFADDDLSTNSTNLSAMFDLFHFHRLWLAQPALGARSHVNVALTARRPSALLRFTSYVNVMCPIFSRDTLAKLAHTFSESVSGWGLNVLWPKLLGYPEDRIAILDAAAVIHTRPHGVGRNYAHCAELGVQPKAEHDGILERYAIPGRLLETYATLPLAAFGAAARAGSAARQDLVVRWIGWR